MGSREEKYTGEVILNIKGKLEVLQNIPPHYCIPLNEMTSAYKVGFLFRVALLEGSSHYHHSALHTPRLNSIAKTTHHCPYGARVLGVVIVEVGVEGERDWEGGWSRGDCRDGGDSWGSVGGDSWGSVGDDTKWWLVVV